jgi:hypothetical protein
MGRAQIWARSHRFRLVWCRHISKFGRTASGAAFLTTASSTFGVRCRRLHFLQPHLHIRRPVPPLFFYHSAVSKCLWTVPPLLHFLQDATTLALLMRCTPTEHTTHSWPTAEKRANSKGAPQALRLSPTSRYCKPSNSQHGTVA